MHCWLRLRRHRWGPWHVSLLWTKGYRACTVCGRWQRSNKIVKGI